jgi:hypothetical protein
MPNEYLEQASGAVLQIWRDAVSENKAGGRQAVRWVNGARRRPSGKDCFAAARCAPGHGMP